jgi:hypothetical protein
MQFVDYIDTLGPPRPIQTGKSPAVVRAVFAAESLMKENPRPGSFLHFQGRIILVLSVNGKSSITFVEGSRVSTIWAPPTFISKPGEHESAARKPEALMGNGYISAQTTWRLMKENRH